MHRATDILRQNYFMDRKYISHLSFLPKRLVMSTSLCGVALRLRFLSVNEESFCGIGTLEVFEGPLRTSGPNCGRVVCIDQ